MTTISKTEREAGLKKFGARFRLIIPDVKGAVPSVLLRPEVVEGWSWLLLRASRDVSDETPDRLADDLRSDAEIKGIVERIGARTALPLGYDVSAWQPTPKVEFWKSHVTALELPNPWVTEDHQDQVFVTRQMGEDFARELKIAAGGGRSYREEYARQNELRLAGLIKQRSPDEPNPFVESFAPGDMFPTALEWHRWRAAEIQKLEMQNPPLANWLKLVAQPQELNPFARNTRNVTRQMEITKADGPFAGMLKRAAAWREAQLEAEVKEAEQLAADARVAAQDAVNKAAVARAQAKFGR